jgi:hypothetical protein
MEETKNQEQTAQLAIGAVSGSFFRLNDWFDSNAESIGQLAEAIGQLNKERLFTETETKRLCLKLSKELIETVRDNNFHFKNMSTIEVLEYLLK